MIIKTLYSVALIIFTISLSNSLVQTQEITNGEVLEVIIISCFKEYADIQYLENKNYRNVDVVVFSNLDFLKKETIFSITTLLNNESLKFVNFSHVYFDQNRPVLIRFDTSIDSLDICKLPFTKVDKNYYKQVEKDFYDTTVFITGTSKALIFEISNDQVERTRLDMYESLPVELWPLDDELLKKEFENE